MTIPRYTVGDNAGQPGIWDRRYRRFLSLPRELRRDRGSLAAMCKRLNERG